MGLFNGVPMRDYVADNFGVATWPPSLNSSVAHTLLTRSPAHARHEHPRLRPGWTPDDSRDFDLGVACHAVLLEGKELTVLPYENYRKNEAKDARAAALAAGQIPALPDQAIAVANMVGKARAKLIECPDLEGIGLATMKAEQTVLWTEGETWCRCRPDWMTADHRLIVSFKTAPNAEPEAFLRHAISLGYDVQAAFELAGLKAATGVDARYVWLVSEVEAPHAASLVGLSPALLHFAQSKMGYAVEKWNDCLTRDHFPAYPDRICYMDPPAYALGNWNERLTLSGANLPDDVEAL